jgi:Tfp pilus assembly protein FimT
MPRIQAKKMTGNCDMIVCRPRKRACQAFTLIELLVVIGLMMLIMGLSFAGWAGMRKGAEMRRSVSTVQTTLMLARQQAVTKRQPVTVQYIAGTITNSMRVTVGTNQQFYSQVYLSPGVKFMSSGTVPFKPNGRAVGLGVQTIDLAGMDSTNHIDVWLLTGATKVY